MSMPGKMTLTKLNDREIVVVREFNAPRELVFDAFTKPELIKRWLTGPPGWSMVTCDIDLTVGGAYRWVWKGPDGTEMAIGGVHREIERPERIVNTQEFDQDWTGGEVIGTMVLTEDNGKTTVTNTLSYPSPEALDAALKTPMEQGMGMSYDKLEEVLELVQG